MKRARRKKLAENIELKQNRDNKIQIDSSLVNYTETTHIVIFEINQFALKRAVPNIATNARY